MNLSFRKVYDSKYGNMTWVTQALYLGNPNVYDAIEYYLKNKFPEAEVGIEDLKYGCVVLISFSDAGNEAEFILTMNSKSLSI